MQKSMLVPTVLALLLVVAGGALPSSAGEAPAAAPSAAASDDPQFSRAQLTEIIGNARKIASGKGVEELLEIPVGGTKQWISVHGRDRANPVLLMIHGGPASPEMPTSWWFQNGWEDYFTVVQWDQRGSGKTYGANDPNVVEPTLSLDRITEDAAEVVQYLRNRYAQQKVFVLGHSWGSLVGLQLAHRHPEWLYAYIGMGQVISGKTGERVGYETTLRMARAANDAKAVSELEGIAPYPNADGTLPIDKINVERKWSVAYGGLTWGRTSLDYYFDLAQFSPEYTVADLAAIHKGSQLSLGRLVPDALNFDYSGMTDWHCPIVMFVGRHDFTTPSVVVADWFTRIHAPAKKLIWFENSAHMMMVEEPGRMLVHLVEDVRPLANAKF